MKLTRSKVSRARQRASRRRTVALGGPPDLPLLLVVLAVLIGVT